MGVGLEPGSGGQGLRAAELKGNPATGRERMLGDPSPALSLIIIFMKHKSDHNTPGPKTKPRDRLLAPHRPHSLHAHLALGVAAAVSHLLSSASHSLPSCLSCCLPGQSHSGFKTHTRCHGRLGASLNAPPPRADTWPVSLWTALSAPPALQVLPSGLWALTAQPHRV